MRWIAWATLVAGLLGLVAWDFAVATTFLSDDFIFRAFARFEDSPLVAFVADKHGGEYYRPVPMLVWWVLDRISGGRVWPFSLLGFCLHLLCSMLLTLVGRKLGASQRAALLAGTLFFIAPAGREAALWFSASTDLLSTAAILAAVLCALGDGWKVRSASVVLVAVACLCKETALVLPVVIAGAYSLRGVVGGGTSSPMKSLFRVLPHVTIALLCLLTRTIVLGGAGGTNDPLAPWWGRCVQVASGLVHAVTAYAPLPEGLAWLGGVSIIAWAVPRVWHGDRMARFSALFVFVAVLPLPAAGWIVGARYFYLPAAGLFLLLAMLLEGVHWFATPIAIVLLLGLGFATGHRRHLEVDLYRQALVSAKEAVAAGVTQGQRIFLVRGAMKDLDLAIKVDLPKGADGLKALVIPDVPASFVLLPPDLSVRAGFLLAQPSLPPAGAYRFGAARIVGLARRDEAPDLEEVLARLPELRMLRLRQEQGRFAWQDTTEEFKRGLE